MVNLPNGHYGKSQILLHWLTVLIIITAYLTMEFRHEFPKGSDLRNLLKTIHFAAGQTLLLVVLARLVLRFFLTAPTTEPRPSPALGKLGDLAHYLLYGFLIAMPLTGWALLNLEGKTISYLGLELPQLLSKNHDWAERLEEIHETGATVGYFLIGLHSAAALFHHFYLKDSTLYKMLPSIRRPSK